MQLIHLVQSEGKHNRSDAMYNVNGPLFVSQRFAESNTCKVAMMQNQDISGPVSFLIKNDSDCNPFPSLDSECYAES